jgi:hypothetical protein
MPVLERKDGGGDDCGSIKAAVAAAIGTTSTD